MEKVYYLSHILNHKMNLFVSLYETRKKRYGVPIDRALKSFSKEKKGFSLKELESLKEAAAWALRIKNKGIKARLMADKSNLMQIYLLLFAFVEKEKGALKCS